MADKRSRDEAAKARIISHMNADHHDSVRLAKKKKQQRRNRLLQQPNEI